MGGSAGLPPSDRARTDAVSGQSPYKDRLYRKKSTVDAFFGKTRTRRRHNRGCCLGSAATAPRPRAPM